MTLHAPRLHHALLAVCLSVAPATGQDNAPTEPQDVAAAAAALESALAELETPANGTLSTGTEARTLAERRADRIAALQQFLATWADRAPRALEVLGVRCRLASLYLTQFEPDRALEEFEVAHSMAPRALTDIRGRAGYGIAQALELQRNTTAATKQLQRTLLEVPGTRYARFSDAALQRLANPRTTGIGSPAPRLGARVGLDGEPFRLPREGRAPSLVAFVSLADSAGFERFCTDLRAALAAGLKRENVFVLTLHAGKDDITAKLGQDSELWNGVNVSQTDAERLDPALLQYEVRGTPATYLLGPAPDNVLLARDPSRRRIREILEAALGRVPPVK